MGTTSSDGPRTSELVNVLLVPMPDPDADPEVIERVTRHLRVELHDLPWESLDTVPGPPPPGKAKGDPATMSAILLGLTAAGGVLPGLINLVGDWLNRQSGRHRVAISIDGDTIELGKATSEEQRHLVDAFIRRHAGP